MAGEILKTFIWGGGGLPKKRRRRDLALLDFARRPQIRIFLRKLLRTVYEVENYLPVFFSYLSVLGFFTRIFMTNLLAGKYFGGGRWAKISNFFWGPDFKLLVEIRWVIGQRWGEGSLVCLTNCVITQKSF